jgi:methylmalonyl-CoA mutase
MSKSLFKEFEPISAKAWKQKIQADLKGADYNEALVWNSIEGIDVKPFYHADNLNEFPNVSATKATAWRICQSIYVANTEKSNAKAIDALQRGAESIKFIIPTTEVSIEALTQNIDLASTSIFFELIFLSEEYVKNLSALSSKVDIYINTDIIGNLAKTGNWFTNLSEDHRVLETIVKNSSTLKSSLSINVSLYQNAGATIVQQLAYALAHANEYLNHFEGKIQNKITFNFSVGSNYFFEIAKLRALRLLWKTLASEYRMNSECHIFATPSKRNKTLYDYNTNMLRTTTECMSAILGGANTISNLPYDAIYHKDNEFGERIARNQLLILKHESYFNTVNNPTDGAYYIEQLTQQFAEKGLSLFKDIESNGGFLKQLKDGTIQRKIKESAALEQKQINTGEIVLLGTNKHPNLNDRMANELELYPFVKTNPRKTLIEPIIEKRLSEKLEQDRLKIE